LRKQQSNCRGHDEKFPQVVTVIYGKQPFAIRAPSQIKMTSFGDGACLGMGHLAARGSLWKGWEDRVLREATI